MENKKTRLVTIDYDEYLELLYYKETLEDARKYREVKHDALSFTAVQRVVSDKLFNYLTIGESVGKIELFRSNYDDRQRES